MPRCNILKNGVTVRLPNHFKPCCYWNKDYTRFEDNPKKYFTTVDRGYNEYYNSEIHQELLSVMGEDSDEWHPGCQKCKHEENIGKRSLREKANDFPVTDSIYYMQLSLNNFCNLLCRTCDTRSSTAISRLVEANPELSQYWLEPAPQIALNVHDIFADLDLSKLGLIELLGGEPFVHPQTTDLLNLLLEQEVLQNVTLKVHTNATFFPKKLVPLLSKLKNIDLRLSIDGYHPGVEYIRLGADWATLKDVTEQWVNFANEYGNTQVCLFQTVSSLSVHLVKHTVYAAEAMGITHDYELVDAPFHMNVRALPTEYVNSIRDNHNALFLNKHTHNPEYYKQLKKFIADTDGIKGKYLHDCLPELVPFLVE